MEWGIIAGLRGWVKSAVIRHEVGISSCIIWTVTT